MNYYIGIDLGTSSCKGILLNRNGAVLADHSVNYPVSTPYTNWSEQDPADWYKATVEILKVLSEGREESVKGVGIAGQMHGLVMLDEHDEVIRPAILWNDGRSAPQTAYLNSLGTLPTLTGNIAFPGFTAPKILWVKENEPENFAKAKKICLPKDYLAYRQDASMRQRSGLSATNSYRLLPRLTCRDSTTRSKRKVEPSPIRFMATSCPIRWCERYTCYCIRHWT